MIRVFSRNNDDKLILCRDISVAHDWPHHAVALGVGNAMLYIGGALPCRDRIAE